MNIKGMNKAKILAALYNGAQTQGMGFLIASSEPMTEDVAASILGEGTEYFDYLKGRVMKINLAGDELNTKLYNRDNGQGRCEEIINNL